MHAIAVTDHNTAEAIEPLQQAASAVEKSPVVFPGVELTAADGSHMLLLADPAASASDVSDLLSRVKIPVDKRGSREARSSLTVEQILDECSDDALLIGAHVNRAQSLLEHRGQQRIAELRHPGLAAVEVDPNQVVERSWLDGSKAQIGRALPEVWASDGHAFCELGQRFAWVKMTKPNLEGLRLALLDGQASLQPAKMGDTEDPNAHAALAIEQISVQNAKLMGRGSPATICFNPWFNVIIGSRGTGKSTFVDFCRKTLRRESELDRTDGNEESSLRNLFNRRMQVPKSRSEEGLLTEKTRVEMVYRKNGERFLLTWDQDGTGQAIVRLEDDGEIPEDGRINERFPARIYSQKQLFALAQDPNALLHVIDDVQDIGKAEIDRCRTRLEATYLSLCAEVRVASAAARDVPARKAELRDIQRKIHTLAQQGHTQVLDSYRIRRQIDDTWTSILEGVEQGLKSAKASAGNLVAADLELGAEAEDDAPRVALRHAHRSLDQIARNLSQDLQMTIAAAELQLSQLHAGAHASEWKAAVESIEKKYQQTARQLEQEGLTDPAEYGILLDRESSLESEIKELERESARARSLERQASQTLAEYRQECQQLSLQRQTFAEKASNDTLRVEVVPFAAHVKLDDELIDILGVEHFEKDRIKIAKCIRPEINAQWDWDRLDGVIDWLRNFHTGASDSWEASDRRFGQAFRKIPPERIDRLALYAPNDEVQVGFRDNRAGGGWRPLSQGSPGQQTAALLAFVLGFGNEPIVLDQPEDDLDNTLVYELLASRFRETKRTRQMIVITHNPNLVVHGDAEYVVSLDVKKGQTAIVRQGGLQEREMRDEICRVMEGGREAFANRFRRIIPPRKSEA